MFIMISLSYLVIMLCTFLLKNSIGLSFSDEIKLKKRAIEKECTIKEIEWKNNCWYYESSPCEDFIAYNIIVNITINNEIREGLLKKYYCSTPTKDVNICPSVNSTFTCFADLKNIDNIKVYTNKNVNSFDLFVIIISTLLYLAYVLVICVKIFKSRKISLQLPKNTTDVELGQISPNHNPSNQILFEQDPSNQTLFEQDTSNQRFIKINGVKKLNPEYKTQEKERKQTNKSKYNKNDLFEYRSESFTDSSDSTDSKKAKHSEDTTE